MKNKPLLILFITIGLLLVPVVYLVRALLFINSNDIEINPLAIFLFVQLTVISCIVAYGVWKVQLWGFYALIGFGFLTTVLDLYSWQTQSFQNSWWVMLDFVSVLAGITLIIQEKVRKPYFNPKIRWWETATRLRVDLPANLYINGQKNEVLVLDVSTTGCFVEFDLPLEVGQTSKIDINHDLLKFESDGLVVRKSENPIGYGIKFENTSKANAKLMKQILKNLRMG